MTAAAKAKGKGKPKGHWITVTYPNGGYHHIFVPAGTAVGAAVGRHRPKPGADSPAKKGSDTRSEAGPDAPKGKGHHVTVAHADGSYHHHHVAGADGKGAKAAAGKFKPKAGDAARAEGRSAPHSAPDVAAGTPTAVRRRALEDAVEKHVASQVGGSWVPGYKPRDVDLPKAGGGVHRIEVKSLHYGSKKEISVHHGALENKVDASLAAPKDTWHTVVHDVRHSSEGGAHAGKYSGHETYYRRAVGPYPLGQMHKVKDAAELKRLIAAPDHELPEKARGAFPAGPALAELRVKAADERAYNNDRKKDRVAKAAAEGRSIYRASKKYREPGQ